MKKIYLVCILFIAITINACSFGGDENTGPVLNENSEESAGDITFPGMKQENFPAPVCRSNLESISKDEWGWYRDKKLLLADSNCIDGRIAVCNFVGQFGEGFYTSVDGNLIQARSCGTNNEFVLYFALQNKGDDCGKVSPVKAMLYRETPGNNVFEKVLNLLLQGVPVGKEGELLSNIPKETRVIEVKYENGRVIANFSKELNSGGGSCMMQSRRAQIERTIKHISVVTNMPIEGVEIQVEGSNEGVLEP